MARLVMQERATAGRFSAASAVRLRAMAIGHPQADLRLRALWSLNVIGQIDESLVGELLSDDSETMRAWTVQLAVASMSPESLAAPLRRLSEQDPSWLVRRYLASAIQRLPADLGWSIASALATREDTQADRELVLLLWYGIASSSDDDLERSLSLADETRVPILRDYILWYAAKRSQQGRNVLAGLVFSTPEHERLHYLELLELAVRGMRGLEAPVGWSDHAADFYDSADASTREASEALGAAFGDAALFSRMREVLANSDADDGARRRALAILETDHATENLSLLLKLLDNQALVRQTIPMLMRFDDPAVADSLITRMRDWPDEIDAAAMEVLVSRPAWANSVLDAIESDTIPKERLTAYDARQIYDLGDEDLRERLASQWGSLGQSSAARKEEIRSMVDAYRSAPLWAYSAEAGGGHFKKLCAACHAAEAEAKNIAPKLAGSGSKGIEYLVENILDPNAVIGRDFQARNVLTVEGSVITGLVENETDSAITIRTATQSVTVAKDDIEEVRVSPNSFMPDGLLATLNDRERLELMKYLMSL